MDFDPHYFCSAAAREDTFKELYSGTMVPCDFCGGSHREHSRCKYTPTLANYKYNVPGAEDICDWYDFGSDSRYFLDTNPPSWKSGDIPKEYRDIPKEYRIDIHPLPKREDHPQGGRRHLRIDVDGSGRLIVFEDVD